MTSPTILGHILMVEDNPGDVRLTKELFDEEEMNPTFHTIPDAGDALDFLYQRGEYANAPSPDVILLDWHLPKSDGGTILEELSNTEDFEDIPVIVQSGSGAELDILQEQEPRADAFVTKPVSPEDLEEIVGED